MAIKDMTGQTFGRLEVIEFSHTNKRGIAYWKCRCSCDGKITVVRGSSLRYGISSSCGCQRIEAAKHNTCDHFITHGRYIGINGKTNEGRSLLAMLQRCYDENHPRYYLYGKRGIKVCDRWMGELGYQNFVEDMGPCPVVDGKRWVIDRLDPDDDYSPDNCRWLPKAENDRKIRKFGSVKEYSIIER